MEKQPMLFRFLFKSSGRYAYAGPMINTGSALIRSRSGMARDGRALSNLIQKLSETVLNVSKSVAHERPSTKNKAQLEQPDTGALCCCACFNGGSVKGASPLVFICPLHINIKNN